MKGGGLSLEAYWSFQWRRVEQEKVRQTRNGDQNPIRLEAKSHSWGGWIALEGLPFHRWHMEVFNKIGDCCGGFVEKPAVYKNKAQYLEKEKSTRKRPLVEPYVNGLGLELGNENLSPDARGNRRATEQPNEKKNKLSWDHRRCYEGARKVNQIVVLKKEDDGLSPLRHWWFTCGSGRRMTGELDEGLFDINEVAGNASGSTGRLFQSEEMKSNGEPEKAIVIPKEKRSMILGRLRRHLGLSGMGKGMQAGEKGEVGQTNGQELAGVGNVFSGFESGLGMEMVGGMFGPGGRSWLSMGTGGLWESKNNKVQVC
ncbi:unnamed protein product [Ilex paraguariensis]|uniref:DUF4283 domain-containing protein n=1 Tax=Ilex paraguariensis TaxID=185542 RepID=A0ABC8SWX7_9AQUA